MNKLLLVVIAFILTGCGSTKPVEPQPLPLPPVKVITETVQLEIYQPPLPPEIQLDDVQWFVLTEDNLEEKIAEIKSFTGSNFVIFGVTPQSYENMAYNLQEIRRYMRQQKEIILYYREATKPKGPSGWLEENQEQQENQVEQAISETETEATAPVTTEPAKEQSFFSRFIPKLGN